MKASLLTGSSNTFAVKEVQLADPIGKEVLVDVRASGLCHSDLTLAQSEGFIPRPVVLGHEISGVVTALGNQVTEFSIGDHVVACLIQACGACMNCVTGNPVRCTNPSALDRKVDEPPRISLDGQAVYQSVGIGGFAEQVLVHSNQLVKIPDAVPFPQAAVLGCGVITGAGSVINAAKVTSGSVIAVIGIGGVGLNGISAAALAGAEIIIAVDLDDEKLERAKMFGATHTVNSKQHNAAEEVKAISGGGVESVIDFVGLSAVAMQAIDMLAPGGTLYEVGLMGMTKPNDLISIHPFGLVQRQIAVQGVMMGSSVPQRDIVKYANLYLQGRFNLDDLITDYVSLDEVNRGYELLKESKTGRVVITADSTS